MTMMKIVLWFILVAIGGYGIAAFMYMSVNPYDWDMGARLAVAAFPVTMLAICSFVEMTHMPMYPAYPPLPPKVKTLAEMAKDART